MKGRAKFIKSKGAKRRWDVPEDPNSKQSTYEFTRRMTALITQMEMPDGTTVPVCGVLFDNSDNTLPLGVHRKVGIPILTKDGKPLTDWADPVVRFYGPPATAPEE